MLYGFFKWRDQISSAYIDEMFEGKEGWSFDHYKLCKGFEKCFASEAFVFFGGPCMFVHSSGLSWDRYLDEQLELFEAWLGYRNIPHDRNDLIIMVDQYRPFNYDEADRWKDLNKQAWWLDEDDIESWKR